MEADKIVELCKAHTLYTWSATGAVNPLPVDRAEGVYLYEPSGKRHIDFNSQLMSVHVGHSHPKVVEAIKSQADKLIYAWPGSATEVRARLASRLAKLMPGDLNTFFFTLGGAEANENAVRAARLMTGRNKILSRYRSYHGATNLTMQLTGDPRRWPNEPGGPGFVKIMDPWPYNYSFGSDPTEITKNSLTYIDEVLMYEGPQNIAAVVLESITGTNGVLLPPPGYLKGLKELLEPHGILLICDEVMAGFGRSGKWFGFQHDDMVPDIVTMAKGLTSSYFPLGAVALSDQVADFFRDNVFWGGLTYNSHPLGLAVAEAVLQVIEDEGLVERSAQMGTVMAQHMDALKSKHRSVREGRNIGLFGMVDLQKDAQGTRIAPYNGSHPAMAKLGAFFREEGLFTFVRWGSFMCNPPLTISEDEMAAAFEIIDRGLAITDEAFEG